MQLRQQCGFEWKYENGPSRVAYGSKQSRKRELQVGMTQQTYVHAYSNSLFCWSRRRQGRAGRGMFTAQHSRSTSNRVERTSLEQFSHSSLVTSLPALAVVTP